MISLLKLKFTGVKIFNVTGTLVDGNQFKVTSNIGWTRIGLYSAIGTSVTKTVSVPSGAKAILFTRYSSPSASSSLGTSIVWFGLYEMPYDNSYAYRSIRYDTNISIGYSSYWKYNTSTVTVISGSGDSPTFSVSYI